MISSMVYWLLVLAYLFGLSSVLLSVLGLGRMLLKREYVIWSPNGEPGPAGKLAKARKIFATLAKTTALLIIGYAARDLRQFYHTYTEHGLRVLRQSGELVEFQKESRNHGPVGQRFTLKFCPDFVPRFEAGNFVEVLVYEERFACESVADRKLGFIVERDEQEHPVVYIADYMKGGQ